MALWLDRHGQGLSLAWVLHFAPEACLARLLRGRTGKHISADIVPGRADRVIDIQAIDSPADAFDCVVCSHVLEHVDDRLALAEIHRVLRPNGTALIMLPVIEGWSRTYERDDLRTPEERKRHFGQADHLRFYGADVRERISSAGFELEEFTAEGEDVVIYGLQRGEKLFIARKKTSGAIAAEGRSRRA